MEKNKFCESESSSLRLFFLVCMKCACVFEFSITRNSCGIKYTFDEKVLFLLFCLSIFHNGFIKYYYEILCAVYTFEITFILDGPIFGW